MTATLCAATFSNSYVLWRKRCVILRFVAVPCYHIRLYLVIENERFGLVFVKTLSIISGTSWILNDIGRNSLPRNRKKIAKFLMRTFTCRYLPLWEEPNKDEDSFLHMQLGINFAIFIFSNTKHFLWCRPNRERRSARIEGRYLSFFISTAKWPQHFIIFFYTDSNKELYTLKYRVTKVCRE